MRGGVDLPGNRSTPSPAYQGGENTANEKVGLHIQFDPVTFLSLTGGASISNYAQYHKISEYISVLNLKCESSSGNADRMELRKYGRRTHLYSYLSYKSLFCIFLRIDLVGSHPPFDLNKC